MLTSCSGEGPPKATAICASVNERLPRTKAGRRGSARGPVERSRDLVTEPPAGHQAEIIALHPDQTDETAPVLNAFLTRYANPITRRNHAAQLRKMLAAVSVPLARITETHLIPWITEPKANNSVRYRLSLCRTFFRWTTRQKVTDTDPTLDLDYLTKQYPKTYGKRQHKHPARFLTKDEAFRKLVGACQDGTDAGLRDEVGIRLGLSGMRVSEILALTWECFTDERIMWMGKGRRARRVTPSRSLVTALHEWQRRWTDATGKAPAPGDTILRQLRPGGDSFTNEHRVQPVNWSEPVRSRATFTELLWHRAELAELGYLAPHDLRRSAAAILHNAKAADGGHLFDLLDIQQVLGHADPATTQRSYLEPISTDTLDRAADYLD
jgi:integrase